MASALNVSVILKQKLHHFINCNTGNIMFNMLIIMMRNQNAVGVIFSKPSRATKTDVDRTRA